MNRRALARLSMFTMIGLLVAAGIRASAQQAKPPQAPAADPWYGRTTRAQFVPAKPGALPFQFEIPKKDWMIVGGPGPGAEVQVVATSKKGDASFIVERTMMQQALDPTDITELFMQLETDNLKKRQPSASQVEARLIEAAGRRIVGIQFARAGIAGAERARQYSMPVGKTLYRLTCAAPANAFDAFAPVCAHIAASFVAKD